MKILLKLSYLGTDFCGYQVQPKGRTVQGELNAAARALFGFDCDVTGCSRTDAGVHANTFCVCLTRRGEKSLETTLNVSRIPMAMNAHLPCDISVKEACLVDDEFHPRYDVKYKEYLYRIFNSPVRDPFESGRSWHIQYDIFSEENIAKMNASAKAFVGKHDFSAFMACGSTVESTVRDVKYAEVKRVGDVIEFRVAADGFLYNMVRIMTGTLVAVAQGKISQDEIGEIIDSHDRRRAGMTAPAEGLYLNFVAY